MAISPEEARRSLEEVQSTAAQTRRMAAYAGADVLFILWGVIWALGYGVTFFMPEIAGWAWAALVVVGVVVTIRVSIRHAPVRSSKAKRIGLFWGALYVYLNLWFLIMYPFIKAEGGEELLRLWKHVWALGATVPMFAYVIMGLWLEHMMFWIGLAVTALIVGGLYVIPLPHYWLYLAVTGGGTLIGTGVVVRRCWRKS